jgi:hypothetical protein
MVETNAGPQEIADGAGLSLPTVKKHVHLIFRKLEVTSRSQLIALMRSAIVRDLSPAKVESRGVVHVDQAAAREQAEAFGASNRDCPICNLTSGFFLHPPYFSLHGVPVVQRIERRFPNSKDPVRQCFTKQICSYLESSFVLNPPIFFD